MKSLLNLKYFCQSFIKRFFLTFVAVYTRECYYFVFDCHIFKIRLAIFAFIFVESFGKINYKILWWARYEPYTFNEFFLYGTVMPFSLSFLIGSDKFMYFSIFLLGTQIDLQILWHALFFWNESHFVKKWLS